MNRIALFLTILFVALACNQKKQLLEVTVEPKEPIIIPEGKTTFQGKEISAPWYTISSITFNWNTDNAEDGVAQILAIIAKSKVASNTAGGSTNFTCAIDGDTLYAMFSTNGAGRIIIERNTPKTSRLGVVCYGFALPSPIPEQFNIPTNVKVYAAQVDDRNFYKTIGRVTATSRITLK